MHEVSARILSAGLTVRFILSSEYQLCALTALNMQPIRRLPTYQDQVKDNHQALLKMATH
jgi:hypothetical protein